MTEWRYACAGSLPQPDNDLSLRLIDARITPAVRAFCGNARTVRQFWELPPYVLTVFAEASMTMLQAAATLTGGKLTPAPEQRDHFAANVLRDTQELLQSKIDAPNRQDQFNAQFISSIDGFTALIDNVPELTEAVRATLSAQLVLSWTAFETLCADLAQASDAACNPESPVLSIRDSFQTLHRLRDNYRRLFPDDSSIELVLADSSLRKLNIVRNVITHRAGVIDSKALTHAYEIGWDTNWTENQPLPIDGETVRTLVSPVLVAGVDLIHAVDRWLARHVEPNGTL